ncbi:DUF6254 family protein [Lederbergia graminis]|uniref:DUF6254 family protein n=1 Tax=Lederbergia graminis TaxID=735518 RepID=A0ABW0LF69_9BACI|nr:DUF6254 family protein [Paenibacillus bovis]HLU22309.1 DUF6254 family protein [Bacillaceae bacterium]
MSHPKREEERRFKDRKQSQNPHGKVKSLKQLADEVDKGK